MRGNTAARTCLRAVPDVTMSSHELFESVLVANRGEIACRIIETLRKLGIRSIAVYSDADAGARHVGMADVAVRIGPAAAQQSYLSIPAILEAARATGATAIHPGYGFLSENADFARACADAGVVFVGPPIGAIDVMGDKIRAKQHVGDRGVPLIEGVGEAGMSDADLIAASQRIGYPLLIKPSAGGGGKGMTVVTAAQDLPEALAGARRVATTAFDDDTLLLERYVDRPRHIEVQVLADAHGAVLHLGERECSLQRRHQKIIEEAPSPLLTPAQRARMGEAACEVARSVDYRGAGTVEFLVSDAAPDDFFFMEMNTRLQVEHPVTELVTGLDLVEQQLRIATGQPLALAQADIVLRGHAIEARLYSEDPARGFLPSTGTVGYLREASGPGIRVDSALIDGLTVSTDYDPMLAKINGFGVDRDEALRRLDEALAETVVLGVRTNREFLRALLADPDVRSGRLDTGLIERTEFDFAAPTDAVFAIAALVQEAQAPSHDAWQRYRGWRLGEHRPSRHRFRIGEVSTDVFVSADTVIVGDGASMSARLSQTGATVRLRLADRGFTATVLQTADHIWIAAEDATFDLAILSRERQLADHRAGLDRAGGPIAPDIRTPMPGTVVSVAVKSGESVAEGQLLVTIEAMKMEHKMLASTTGVVTIDVSQGDLVSLDQVVARISPHEGAAA
jgi:acetyl-CoA/propionyl-CoA carboxylase, biotin carboxylase, biotin carboxyl carrier protein